jgi:hypothetical protein
LHLKEEFARKETIARVAQLFRSLAMMAISVPVLATMLWMRQTNVLLAMYVTQRQISRLHLMKHLKEGQYVQQGIIASQQQEVRMLVALLFCRYDASLELTDRILEPP